MKHIVRNIHGRSTFMIACVSRGEETQKLKKALIK
jgi:hypothetical protein